MRHEPSTARTRELGHELRRIRKRAGYTGTDMARRLGWGIPKVSRLESGQRILLPENIAAYLASARATPEELNELVALASEAHSHRLQFHSAGLPDRLRTLTLLETHSRAITAYSQDLIPALLQTEPYIRALLPRYGHTPGPELESAVEARLNRQTIFTRQPCPEFTFYIHEDALRTTVGEHVVMHEQLLQLQMSSSLPDCHIHVVPATTERADNRLEFSIFQHDQAPPVLHIDAHTASLFLESYPEIAFYQDLLHHLATAALDREQSLKWIVNRTRELEQNTPGNTRRTRN